MSNRKPSRPGRSAIYARYSSAKQDGGVSIEVQLEHCRKEAGSQPLEYIDRAVSGTVMSRPQFNRMLADAEAGAFSTLYVYKYDRFGRSAHAHGIVADLEALGVSVVSVTEGRDALLRGIQLVLAEDYSRKLSERTRHAKRVRFEQGYWKGGAPPFGYDIKDKRLVVNQSEADAIRWAYDLYLTGKYATRDVGDMLEARGFRPRLGGDWSVDGLGRLFTLPIYRGVVRYRGGELERYDEALRVVSEDQHRRMQAIYGDPARNCRGGASPKQVRIFTGLLHCSCCGGSFLRATYRGPSKVYPVARWMCRRRTITRGKNCSMMAVIREDHLTEALDLRLRDALVNCRQLVREAVDQMYAMMDAERPDHAAHLATLQRLEVEIENLAQAVAAGRNSAALPVIMDQIAERTKKRDALARQVERDAACRPDRDELAQRVAAKLDASRGILAAGTDYERNQILRECVGPMTVESSTLISLRGEDERGPVSTAQVIRVIVRQHGPDLLLRAA